MIVEFDLDKASDLDIVNLASMLQTFSTLRRTAQEFKNDTQANPHSTQDALQNASDFKQRIRAVCSSLEWTVNEGDDWRAYYVPSCSWCGGSNIDWVSEWEEFSSCNDCNKLNSNPTRVQRHGTNNMMEIPDDLPRLDPVLTKLKTSRRCGHTTRKGHPCQHMVRDVQHQCPAGHKIG